MGVGKGRWQGVSLPPRAPPPPKPRRGKRWTIPEKGEKPSLLCAAVLALLGTINAASALALAVHGTSSLPTPTPVALADPAHHVIAPPHVTLLHAASMMAAVAVLFALDAAMDWLAEVLGVSEEVGWMGAGARWVVSAAPGVREWARRKMGCRARKNGKFPVARTVTRTLAASAAIIAILAAMRRGLGGSVTWSNLTDAAMLLPIGFFTVTMLQWIQADLAPRKSKQLRLLRRCRTAKILKPSAASPGYVNVATATGVVFVTAVAYILSSPWLSSFPFDAGISILVAAVLAFADSRRWWRSDSTGRWISNITMAIGDWVSDPCLVTLRGVRAHVNEALDRERKLHGLSLAAPSRHARRRATRTSRGLSRPRLLPRAPRCRLLLAVALGVVRVLLGARSLVGSIPVLAKHLLEPILNWASEEGQKVGPPTVPGAWMDMDEAARQRLATLLTAKEINWFVQSAEEQGSYHDRLARAFTSPAFAAQDRRLEHWLTVDEILAAKLCRAWFRAPWDPDAQAWMSVPAAAQSRSTRRRRHRRFRLLLGPVLALATKTAWLANEALLSIETQTAELNGENPVLGTDDLPPLCRKTREVILAEIAFLSAPRHVPGSEGTAKGKAKAKAPPGGADGDGLEPPPSKVGKVCGRCGGADHERASNRLCPYHKPTIKATAKKDVEQVTGKTVPSTIKLPLKGLCTSSPASFASVHDTLALAYTPVAIAAALLLNEGVAAWVTDNRVLPQLNQSLLRRVFFLCASGELRIQASDSLQGQEEFLRSLERIWLGDGGTPGLRASYPARFAAFRAPGARGSASPNRMIDQYFSSEFDNIYNATFKDYQVNIEVHLESAANRNFKKLAELRFDKLPWWNAVVDGDPEKELPAERKSAIFASLLSASKSRRRPLKIFSRTAAAGDHYLTEQDVELAVAAGQSLTYGWKTPSMQHHRSAVLGPHFLEALLRDVRAGRDLHVSMRGEFASWFEEEFETIMETVVLNKVARAQLAKDLVARITSTGAHKFSARHIALGEGPAAIPWDTLQAAANTGNGLLLDRRAGKTAVVRDRLQHATIVQLVTFLQEAWGRQNDIERNGMQGGVKDWNTRLRFLHRSNCLIGALYDITVPAGPFDPQWQPPLPPTSALLPYFNYQTKHVKVATFDALLEVVKRHKRMFPAEHAAVMDDHFPFGEDFDERDDYHRRRLWAAVYDTDSLLQREVRGGFRDNYVGDKTRAFAFAVSSNGVEASVLFNKAVPNDDFEPEGEAREAGGADDEARIVREAAAAAFHAGLRRGMERAVQFEDQARRGEIKLHVQGLDPGPGGFTLARRTEDGEARSKVFFYSFKQYHYESGVTKRKRQQEALTKTMHVTTAAGPVSIQNIINAIPASTITAVDAIHRRNMYILTHLDTLVRFYSEFRDERFQNYRGKQIALERMAQELLAMEHESKTGSPKTTETKAARRNRKGWRRWFRSKRRKRAGGHRLPERYVIVWGNAKVGSMSWIKKQMRGPFKKLIALLEARSDVVIVMEDEYGTSKCCHSCDQWSLDTRKCRQMPKELEPTYRPPVVAEGEQGEERKWHVPMVIPTKKPWYVRWCFNPACPVDHIHRDVNAALNMLRLYEWRLWQWRTAPGIDVEQTGRPPGLRRLS